MQAHTPAHSMKNMLPTLLSKHIYGKIPNNSDTWKHCNHFKIETLYYRITYPQEGDYMTNSIDPDQTAPNLIWNYTICSELSLKL